MGWGDGGMGGWGVGGGWDGMGTRKDSTTALGKTDQLPYNHGVIFYTPQVFSHHTVVR